MAFPAGLASTSGNLQLAYRLRGGKCLSLPEGLCISLNSLVTEIYRIKNATRVGMHTYVFSCFLHRPAVRQLASSKLHTHFSFH